MSLTDVAYNYTPDDTGTPARQPPPVSAGPTPEESARESWPPFSETGGTTVGGRPAEHGPPQPQGSWLQNLLASTGGVNLSGLPQANQPGWIGALANFWNQLNTPPEGQSPGQAIRAFLLGQPPPPPQGGADARAGVYDTPEEPRRPLDVAAATEIATAQASRLRPDEVKWPDSPIYSKDKPDEEKPDTTGQKPPEPKQATPRQDPYRPSRLDRPMNDLGKPDLVLQGMQNYPGLLQGPYGPQPHEWRGIMQNSTRFLGNLGSGIVAPLAQALFALEPAYWQARQRGEEHNARMHAANYALYAKQLAQKQAQESRDLAGAFAAYGPRTENGKHISGDLDALRAEIREIANRNQDVKLLTALDRGDFPAVERLARARDAKNQDIVKTLTQMSKERAIRLQDLKIKAEEEKARARQTRQENGLAPPEGPAAGKGPSTEVDPNELQRDYPKEPTDEKTDTTDTTETDDTGDTDDSAKADTEEQQAQAEPSAQREATSETPAAPAAEAAGAPTAAAEPTEPAQAAAARPVRLAMRDTGTATDAPQPGERPAEAPREREREPAPTREAAAVPRPAAGTPEAMGATAPVPSLQEPGAPARRPAPTPAATPQEPAAAAAAAPPPFKFSDKVKNEVTNFRMTDSQGRVRRADVDGIETLALQMVNKTVRIQDLHNYADWYKDLAQRRGDEVIRDMHRIATDPNVRPQDVLPLLQQINPEFAATTKAQVEGRSAVPASQWANPGYRNRTLLLGSKIAPGFNEATQKTIVGTYKAFTTGRQSDWVTAVGTTYGHGSQLEADIHKYPGLVARLAAGTSLADFLNISKADQKTMARLKAELDTFNSEYEYAVSRGKPTVYARRQQAEQAPLVFGNQTTLLANIGAKKEMLETRYGQLRGQFIAGTGQQPDALIKRLDEVGQQEATIGLRAIDQARAARGFSKPPDWMVREVPPEPLVIKGVNVTAAPTAVPAAPAAPAMPPGWTVERQ